ncbi:MAG: sigma-70 family RNA polymerase sigma factor [Deltaproteobacteria bacterium]|nr:sigma-70 family RNA polymerase sigma factor [Deltaproteobacteria bacterium]
MGKMRGRSSSTVAEVWDDLEVGFDEEGEPEGEDLRRSSLAISGERVTLRAEDTAIGVPLMQGDAHQAVAVAARLLGPSVGRLCFLLLGSQCEADEAAQETFLAVYHGASSYRAEGSPRSWIFGIARRICAQRLSARMRQSRRMFLLDRESHGLDASDLHDRAEREARIRAALDELPENDRELLALRYDAEQSFRDIALALGIDEAAARKRVGRALIRLREKLRAA